MRYTEVAFAKLNLSLDIVSKRNDGYHDLISVMQSIGLSDEITIECVPGKGITIENSVPYLPEDERNIAVMAALEFFDYTGIQGYQTHIRIEKNIPVCAGLGGGSADGACVLRMLDRMFDTNLGVATLETIGGAFGSDVPFCVAGGTMLAQGKGDILTNLAPIPQSFVVVSTPMFTCSTPELFALVRCEKIRSRPDTEGILAALDSGDLRGIAQRLYNVFEDILPRGSREVEDIKYAMLDNNALGAAMSGSGPTVFGLFDDESNAIRAYRHLKKTYNDTFLTRTVESVFVGY